MRDQRKRRWPPDENNDSDFIIDNSELAEVERGLDCCERIGYRNMEAREFDFLFFVY